MPMMSQVIMGETEVSVAVVVVNVQLPQLWEDIKQEEGNVDKVIPLGSFVPCCSSVHYSQHAFIHVCYI